MRYGDGAKIAELEAALAESQANENRLKDVFAKSRSELQAKLEASERAAAALREALDELQDHHCSGICDESEGGEHDQVMTKTNAALASDAGQDFVPRAELDQTRRDYEGACKLVADMHAAATGRFGGPVRRGPLEDVEDLAAAACAAAFDCGRLEEQFERNDDWWSEMHTRAVAQRDAARKVPK